MSSVEKGVDELNNAQQIEVQIGGLSPTARSYSRKLPISVNQKASHEKSPRDREGNAEVSGKAEPDVVPVSRKGMAFAETP